MSHIRPKGTVEMDSVEREKQAGSRRHFDILLEAQRYWDNMSEFRRERERSKRYTYGDQWGDIIEVRGKRMTEKEYIRSNGSVPLTNNLIRRLVKNVLGTFRGQSKEPTCMARDRDEQKLGEVMSTLLQYNMQLNRMKEIYGRSMEEFLISGFVVHRKWYGWRNCRTDCWTDYVQPNNFFIDTNMRDMRGWDCTMLGEIHDISFDALCEQFATSRADYERYRNIYATARDRQTMGTYAERFGRSRLSTIDFLCPATPGLCRVIEVWRKETKPRYRCHDYNNGDVYKIEESDYNDMVADENRRRMEQAAAHGMPPEEVPLIEATWFMDNYWYYYYLTPFGDVLQEGETPYAHKSHPYVFKAYPFIDGEIHSFVSDVIDQQRYTNRLITMYDWIMRSSAKGVLLIPEDCKPDDMSWDDIAEEWSRFDGMIVYKPKPGVAAPQQVATNATNIGISELLNLQLKFFEDISGVNGALQGKPGYSGTSAALYAQQSQNATTSLIDLLDSFSMFVTDAAYKDVKNIQQFYDDAQIVNIAGKNARIETDPKKIRDTEFDLAIMESTATPAYRQIANDTLMELWRAQAINTEMLLEHADFPYADDLLQALQAQKEQAEQSGQPQGLPPQLQQQAQQGANMGAVNQLYNAMKAD
jgi:hypothetical protein